MAGQRLGGRGLELRHPGNPKVVVDGPHDDVLAPELHPRPGRAFQHGLREVGVPARTEAAEVPFVRAALLEDVIHMPAPPARGPARASARPAQLPHGERDVGTKRPDLPFGAQAAAASAGDVQRHGFPRPYPPPARCLDEGGHRHLGGGIDVDAFALLEEQAGALRLGVAHAVHETAAVQQGIVEPAPRWSTAGSCWPAPARGCSATSRGRRGPGRACGNPPPTHRSWA